MHISQVIRCGNTTLDRQETNYCIMYVRLLHDIFDKELVVRIVYAVQVDNRMIQMYKLIFKLLPFQWTYITRIKVSDKFRNRTLRGKYVLFLIFP